MTTESLNLIFAVAAIAVGAFSVLLAWLYLIETGRGIHAFSFEEYKHHINTTFWISCLVLSFLWLTTTEMDDLILSTFLGNLFAWFSTGLLGMLVSLSGNIAYEDKSAMRRLTLPCVFKVLILLLLLWLLF